MLWPIPDQLILAFTTTDLGLGFSDMLHWLPLVQLPKCSCCCIISCSLCPGDYSIKTTCCCQLSGVLEGGEVDVCLFNPPSLTGHPISPSFETQWKPIWWVRSISPLYLVFSQNVPIATKYVWLWCIVWFERTKSLTSPDQRIGSVFWAYHKYAKLFNTLRKWFVLWVEQSLHIILKLFSTF